MGAGEFSIPFLHLSPGFSQIASKSATEKNIEMFVAPRIRMLGAPNNFHAREMFAIASAVTAQDNDSAAVIIARPPQPVALMIANRLGQTQARSEKIDRAGLAVTIGED